MFITVRVVDITYKHNKHDFILKTDRQFQC